MKTRSVIGLVVLASVVNTACSLVFTHTSATMGTRSEQAGSPEMPYVKSVKTSDIVVTVNAMDDGIEVSASQDRTCGQFEMVPMNNYTTTTRQLRTETTTQVGGTVVKEEGSGGTGWIVADIIIGSLFSAGGAAVALGAGGDGNTAVYGAIAGGWGLFELGAGLYRAFSTIDTSSLQSKTKVEKEISRYACDVAYFPNSTASVDIGGAKFVANFEQQKLVIPLPDDAVLAKQWNAPVVNVNATIVDEEMNKHATTKQVDLRNAPRFERAALAFLSKRLNDGLAAKDDAVASLCDQIVALYPRASAACGTAQNQVKLWREEAQRKNEEELALAQAKKEAEERAVHEAAVEKEVKRLMSSTRHLVKVTNRLRACASKHPLVNRQSNVVKKFAEELSKEDHDLIDDVIEKLANRVAHNDAQLGAYSLGRCMEKADAEIETSAEMLSLFCTFAKHSENSTLNGKCEEITKAMEQARKDQEAEQKRMAEASEAQARGAVDYSLVASAAAGVFAEQVKAPSQTHCPTTRVVWADVPTYVVHLVCDTPNSFGVMLRYSVLIRISIKENKVSWNSWGLAFALANQVSDPPTREEVERAKNW